MPASEPAAAAPFDVVEIFEASDEVVAALQRLVPQLSATAAVPARERIREIAASEHCTLLVARTRDEQPAIVGTLTLVAYPLPSGLRVWIEDVVVDQAARGRGVGEALVREAVSRAAGLGAAAVNLTSNPERAAANRLYQRVGFVRRETNTYRYFLRE